jgi:hypothetical protein
VLSVASQNSFPQVSRRHDYFLKKQIHCRREFRCLRLPAVLFVANIYYVQPLIDMIGPSVGLGPRDANAAARKHHGHYGTSAALISGRPASYKVFPCPGLRLLVQ